MRLPRLILASIAMVLAACATTPAHENLQSWEAQSARSGPWAPDVLRLNKAYTEQDWGRLRELIEQLRPEFRTRYGEASPSFAEATTLEGLMLFEENRDQEALPVLLRAAELYEAALGPDHRDVAIALHTYADAVIELQGDNGLEEAERTYRRVVQIRTRLRLVPERIAANTELVRTLTRHGVRDGDDAILAEAEQLGLANAHAGADGARDAEDYAGAWEVYVAAASARQRYAEAEANLRAELAAQPARGRQFTDYAEYQLTQMLVTLLEVQGRDEEAKEVRRQSNFDMTSALTQPPN